jgi:glutaredoxin-like protein NrdH
MTVEHVSGRKVGNIMLYGLSTCQWCNKTKELLRDLGLDFNFVYVDLLEGEEQDKALSEMERWNPRGSFPTLVIDDTRCIIGYQESQIRKEFGT